MSGLDIRNGHLHEFALGKRIVQLQTSLALAQSAGAANNAPKTDQFGREPFTHPSLEGLGNLSTSTKSFLTDRTKMAELARKYDMQKVIRWEPRKVGENTPASILLCC
jgi:large subunit ribosomal protein L15